ncbi:MAG: hypothetical protein HY299_01675 [Verrucomicrobia bacterium]|nr:hypothetical protein [Verrucomicrobiota bacterium]
MQPETSILLGLSLSAAVGLSNAEAAQMRTVHSQPSYILSNGQVELAVTQLGGHLAPVTFFKDSDQPIQPYHISPWQDERRSPMPAEVLVPLRGDFFCLPFGGNAEEARGERHPAHGETATGRWSGAVVAKSGDVATLTLSMDTKIRKGHVTKRLSIVDGQNIVYSQHTIEGFAGPVPLGHHATLAMPDADGSVRVTTSDFQLGMTCPGMFSDPKKAEYQSLLPGAEWKDLAHVPAMAKGASEADLTRLPARRGFADLVQLVNVARDATQGPAWTAATFSDAGYVWFAMKDPAMLNSTVIWIENHGRHGHPWRGRNNCLGLEDVTAHFADGLAASIRENTLTRQGFATAVELKSDHPTRVNYIQGVVKTPRGFERVQTIEFSPGRATFVSTTGIRVSAPVRHEFIQSGTL